LTFSAKLSHTGELLDMDVTSGVLRNVQAIPYDMVDRLLQHDQPSLPLPSPSSSPHALHCKASGGSPGTSKNAAPLHDDLAQHVQYSPALKQLWQLAIARRRVRRTNGAVPLSIPRPSVTLRDGEIHVSTDASYSKASRVLVEEMMVLAGEIAARFCSNHQIAIPYRVQQPPSLPLDAILATAKEAKMPSDIVPFYVISHLNAAEHSAVPGAHWALGLESYTRCSSPIRRYADLLVHQQLSAFLATGKPLMRYTHMRDRIDWLDATTKYIKNQAQAAQRAWVLAALNSRMHNHQVMTRGVVVDWYPEGAKLMCEMLLPDIAFMRVAVALPLDDPLPNLTHGSTFALRIREANPTSMTFKLDVENVDTGYATTRAIAWPKAAIDFDGMM
jgi:hypothetical protein